MNRTTFHAIDTRDHAARQYDGQRCEIEFYRTDENGTRLYEATFNDGGIILVTARDLGL